jgi:hypothetical protein
MEPLTDPVSLRGSGFSFRVVDIIDSQVQLKIVTFRPATVFRFPISQDAQQR